MFWLSFVKCYCSCMFVIWKLHFYSIPQHPAPHPTPTHPASTQSQQDHFLVWPLCILLPPFWFINPFAAPVWTNSRLNDAQTRLQTVYFPVYIYPIDFQCCTFWWNSFHMPVWKRRQKGSGVSNFTVLCVVIAVKGLKQWRGFILMPWVLDPPTSTCVTVPA